MTEERFTRDYPPFRDEFGCVNNLINGDSYVCGETGFINERDAIDTAIEVCRVFNEMYFENEQLKSEIQQYKRLLQDMGLLMSDDEVINIREDIADKHKKPTKTEEMIN